MKSRLIFGYLFLLSLTPAPNLFAEVIQNSVLGDQAPSLISAVEVSAIAKEAIAQELGVLNSSLLNPNEGSSSYDTRLLERFFENTFKNQIDLEHLYGKCVFANSDLLNLNHPVLRPEDDVTAARIRSLESIGALYGNDVWRLFTQACNFARARFEDRISQLTSNGTPLNLSEEQIKNLSSIIFFPTAAGSAPSRTKEFFSSLFRSSFFGAMIFGPVSVLSGLAIGGSVILVANASNASSGLLNELISIFQKTPNEKLAALLARSPIDVRIDLTPSEEAFLKAI